MTDTMGPSLGQEVSGAPPLDIGQPKPVQPNLRALFKAGQAGGTQYLESHATNGPHPIRQHESNVLTDRISGLAQAHPWMPHQALAAIATLPASDQALAQMAASLRTAYSKTSNAIHYLTDDPLLQKEPSLGLSLKMYLTSNIGPWPIQDSDLVHVQKQLQGQGLAQGLKTDGVWNSQWNAAYAEYVFQAKDRELGGSKPGSTPLGTALGWLNDLFPKEAAGAVGGFVTAIPSEGATAMRDVAGQFASSSHVLLENPVGNFNRPAENRAAASAENVVQGALGQHKNITPQSAISNQPLRVQLSHAASVVGDLLILHGLFGAGKTLAQAAGEAGIRGLDRQAASRGPGIIAKSLYDTTGATSAGPLSTTGSKGGLFASKMFENVPILKYTGPVADRIIGSNGLYYRARTLLATPYAYGPVRVAGTAVGQLGYAGIKTRAIAGAESAVAGQTSPIQASIDHFHSLDYLDHSVQSRLGFTVLGHHVSPGLDTIAWLLHPPLSGTGLVSQTVGRDLHGVHQGINDALGPSTGYAAAIERGVNAAQAGQRHVPFQQLVDNFGGAANFNTWWLDQIAKHAAAHYADAAYANALKMDPTAIEDAGGVVAFKRAMAHQARTDPELIRKNAAEMIANDNPNHSMGPNELSWRIAQSITKTKGGVREWIKDNGANWANGSRIMRNEILPRQAELLSEDIPKGVLGMARNDYLFKDMAVAQANQMADQYEAAIRAGQFSKIDATASEVRAYLAHTYGVTDVPADGEDLIALLKKLAGEQSPRVFLRGGAQRDRIKAELSQAQADLKAIQGRHGAATELRSNAGADQELVSAQNRVSELEAQLSQAPVHASDGLKSAFAKLHDLGYTPVMGTDIGHAFYDQPNIDLFDGGLTRARRLVEKTGLSPESIPTHDLGFQANLNFENELIDSIKSGKLRPAPYDTAHAIVSKIRQGVASPKDPGWIHQMQKTFGHFSYRTNLRQVTDQIYNTSTLTRGEAEREAAARLAATVENPMGWLHISYGQLKKILGQPVDEKNPVEAALAKEQEYQHYKANQGVVYKPQPAYSEPDIQEIFRAMQRAKAKMPWRMTGFQALEDLATQRVGLAGRVLPGSLGRLVENMPSNYTALRNKFRFTLSPEFSLRRIVKNNAKVSLDGVPPTLMPLHAMEARGITQDALATLDRVMPEWATQSAHTYDEGAQSLYAGDVFGLFNARNQEAYAAWHWEKMGKTDTEIRQLLIKDFSYGSRAFGEGRTAMERSMNFVFFPFSFDKTLYRNVGAYLLDRPAQRMMLTAGLSAYHRWNEEHPNGDLIGTSSWFQKHMPLAQEALRLNAFAHGLGLGQFGGINAPVLNLFIPQSYNADKGSLQVVKGFIPVISELQNVGKELGDTAQIGKTELDNIGHGPGSIWQPQQVAETKSAQLYDAYSYHRQLTQELAQWVHYNAHHSPKLKVPQDPAKFGQFVGHTIDSALIGEMVQAKYPAYDPAVQTPSAFYAQQAVLIDEYRQHMLTTGHHEVAQWIDNAQLWGKAIYKGTVDPGTAKQGTQIVRNYAIRYAETIPGFLKFYDTNYRWQFGPLEGVG